MVYIGIDLGGTGIKIGVVDESGAILSQGETPTLAGRPYEDIIADMGRCMLDVMARGGFEEKDVASIGVGIPGVADEKTGHVIFCTNLGWSDVPLRTELQKYLSKPVYIDNDATVAGFAESICGVSAGCHSSVFMTLGTGVGGGIVIGGRPWSGFHGVGSEIGHIPMDIGGLLLRQLRLPGALLQRHGGHPHGQANGVAAPRQPDVRPVRRRCEQADGQDGL